MNHIYASVSDDGTPVAFYPDTVYRHDKDGNLHVDIPPNAVRLSEAAFRELIDNAGRRKIVDGKVVEYAPPVPPEDIEVTNHQLRIALHDAGKLDTVETAVRSSGNVRAVTDWDFANTFKRASPFVRKLQALLRMADGEVDALFEAASRIK